MWLQKSRMRWLREGGRNTRFFHRVCKDRVVRRSLVNLRVNNEICEDPDQNKCSIFNHLKKKLRLVKEGVCN